MEITFHANCSDRCLIASLNRGWKFTRGYSRLLCLTTFYLSLKQWKYSAPTRSFCCAGSFSPTNSCAPSPAPTSPIPAPLTRGSLPASGSAKSFLKVPKGFSRFVPEGTMVKKSVDYGFLKQRGAFTMAGTCCSPSCNCTSIANA